MNTKKRIAVIAIAVIIAAAGCHTNGPSAEKPPRQIKRVQVVPYDQKYRPMSESVEILDRPPSRPYKKIALITCEGSYREEAIMMQAIIYKARQLGASAIIELPPNNSSAGGAVVLVAKLRCLYRATAIVYDAGK